MKKTHDRPGAEQEPEEEARGASENVTPAAGRKTGPRWSTKEEARAVRRQIAADIGKSHRKIYKRTWDVLLGSTIRDEVGSGE